MKRAEAEAVRVGWGQGEKRQGVQRSLCADWNRGQRAQPFTSLPLGPRRPDNEPSRLPRPHHRSVSSQPRSRPAPLPQGLQSRAPGGRGTLWQVGFLTTGSCTARSSFSGASVSHQAPGFKAVAFQD